MRLRPFNTPRAERRKQRFPAPAGLNFPEIGPKRTVNTKIRRESVRKQTERGAPINTGPAPDQAEPGVSGRGKGKKEMDKGNIRIRLSRVPIPLVGSVLISVD